MRAVELDLIMYGGFSYSEVVNCTADDIILYHGILSARRERQQEREEEWLQEELARNNRR